MQCHDCKQEIPPKPPGYSGESGYGTVLNPDGSRVDICYPCCAERDRAELRSSDRWDGYVTRDAQGGYSVSNWPGSLKIRAEGKTRRNGHNWCNVQRTDVWFVGPDGAQWHGVNLGDNDVVRCRKSKPRATRRRMAGR
jgi:hypothetical protein